MAAEDKAKKRVLVLGAGGYVGRHLVATLGRTDWALPVAAVRPMPAAASALPSVKLLSYDARSPSALDGRLGDIDCVVNCVAGDASSMVKSAQHLFAALPGRALSASSTWSSMVVHGATGLVDEDAPITRGGDDYTGRRLRASSSPALTRDPGGDVVVLRLASIYGPAASSGRGEIGQLLAAGRIGDLGPAGDGCCNRIYIDDMISAIMQALVRPGLAGEAFNVSNANPETWNQYFVRFGRRLGSTPIKRIFPSIVSHRNQGDRPDPQSGRVGGSARGGERFPPARDNLTLGLQAYGDAKSSSMSKRADARLCFPGHRSMKGSWRPRTGSIPRSLNLDERPTGQRLGDRRVEAPGR
ncbi:MAG: NAD(P)-dependent oxidoreductase [Rhodospirillales bacterium]|nr:NAD(P)-dependent oxidoreductase [Rhodospirillales bacterium]